MHYLLVFQILSASCSMVVSCIPMHCKQNQLSTESTENDFLIDLDESSSRCGQYEIDIRDLTIPQFQEHFQTGRLTSTELTECYLNRIAKIDRHLRSVIEVNPEAIALAEKADKERHANSNQSPMHGIPILIKDNIGTADRMQTTAGASALKDLKPKRDADVVQRLRKAGAIILGKTNLSEWASFRDENTPNGWSSRGGQTVCAYVMDADPSGSSTGSAVSVSTNLASVSLGTETDGSIISPASRNGVVGLKTTFGKVSTKGAIPLSFSKDVIGPMARSVRDAAFLLGTISGIDLQGCDGDISTCLPEKKLKVGVLRDPFWNLSEPDIIRILPGLEACLNKIKESELVEVIDPVRSSILTPEIREEVVVIFGHEFKFSINHYLKDDVYHFETELGRNISSLADIIKYNRLNPPKEGYQQNLLELSEATDGLENRLYIDEKSKSIRESILYLESIFEKYEVDALATPCVLMYSFGAFAGYPTITVPVGVDSVGLPFGICLLGKLNSELELLKLGYIIEQSRSAKRPYPRFIRENK